MEQILRDLSFFVLKTLKKNSFLTITVYLLLKQHTFDISTLKLFYILFSSSGLYRFK